jgi:hypothetical protein
MKANPWVTYRTRFLVKAKQLTASLSFTDALGRQHSGGKGDYLVEYSDYVLRIVPRQIFQDIYVPLMPDAVETDTSLNETWRAAESTRERVTHAHASEFPADMIRKTPQSDRSRRGPISQSL